MANAPTFNMSHTGQGNQTGQVQGGLNQYGGDNKSTNYQGPITTGHGANFGSGQNYSTTVGNVTGNNNAICGPGQQTLNTSGKPKSEQDTIEKFCKDLGLTEEQIKEALLKLVGTSENYDRLESLVTLKPDFKSFLPEVRVMTKSTCLLKNGTGVGTGFLAKVEGFSGVIFFSAGHNFRDDNKNPLTKFHKIQLLFNNLDGTRYGSLSAGGVIHKHLTDFMNNFDSKIVLRIGGKQVFLETGERAQITSLVPQENHQDFFAMMLFDNEDETVEKWVKENGMDVLTCASYEDELTTTKTRPRGSLLSREMGAPVSVVGHPCLADKRYGCNCTEHPMIFSWGNEQESPNTKRIYYDLDTEGGNSGSPVTGKKNYTVRGIHVQGGTINKAEPMKTILEVLRGIEPRIPKIGATRPAPSP